MVAGTSVRLLIPSEIKLVDLVHAASEKMASLAGFDEDESLNVGLAVREAVINAIIHGNKQDPSLEVDLTLTVESQGLTARILDQGNGFDPEQTPSPTEGDNLLRTTGRGLLLIKAFVDEVDFRQSKSGGMEIILTKRNGTKEKA